ncbi:MAG TPA: IspD/TarI family cytidylyltransferase [Ktedonobacteraceae bacterium]|jgi:2-C-methyl-D-erythritol 4-phosphate cytidylyltransferase
MGEKQDALRRVVSIVLCAGRGKRVGHQLNKVLLPIEGQPMFLYSVLAFERCPVIDEILLVGAAGEEGQLNKLVQYVQCGKVRHVIRGGDTRHASEYCALQFLRERIETGEIEIILIHDGARPFISVQQVTQVIEKAREVGGAILAAPLQEEEHIVRVVDETRAIQQGFSDGDQIWKAQTPQAFQAPSLLCAYDQAEREQIQGTDTASVLEQFGYPVAVVNGSSTNLKVTTASDLFYIERLIRHHRI